METINVKGARVHNLKNISVTLPRNKMIVISGRSGSGKSSLAFDTIFAEGQRRYVESLSSFARQFLGRLDKPEVDSIDGLSPTIAIEQKTTSHNPRSTVGTVTEIYDYYRLLFARIGQPRCPICGAPIQKKTVDEIVDFIMSLKEGTKISLLAPVVRRKKGEHAKVFEDARKLGYVRARVDSQFVNLEEEIALDKKLMHTIDITVDRIKVEKPQQGRIAESVEAAFSLADELVILVQHLESGDKENLFSGKGGCPNHPEVVFPTLEPRMFSFNNPLGACPECSGLGKTIEFDLDLIIPDRSKSFNQDGFLPYKTKYQGSGKLFSELSQALKFSLDTPIKELEKPVLGALLWGMDPGKGRTMPEGFHGIMEDLKKRYKTAWMESIKVWFQTFMREKTCSCCQGRKLKPESLSVYLENLSIDALTDLTITESLDFFQKLELNPTQKKIAQSILLEIQSRLNFLYKVGLDYLSLSREASTLSGGESQRIRLATQVGSQLMGILYVLDEPTIGLHQRDNERLIKTLLDLRDQGNTLIVVEHDEETIRAADYLVDIGPGSGVHGGRVLAQGSLQDLLSNPDSVTGQWLSGQVVMPLRTSRRVGNGKFLSVKGVKLHNLKNIDVDFPLGTMIAVTGVSGSGKSSLVSEVLYPSLAHLLNGAGAPESGLFDKLEGLEHLDKVIAVDQSPIGRTPRSNPATYIGVFDLIRQLFSNHPEAKARGFLPGRFSFNTKGGRCEHCQGNGLIQIEMNFLADVYVPCPVCQGKRFNQATLEVRYKGKDISEILDMTVDEALEFFKELRPIARKIETLQAVGLGYMHLGQSGTSLSGGEAQRVKLSYELSKTATGKTLYIIDEPTTGLHFLDIKLLVEILHMLVDQGNTIILIEHNMDVIKQCDWLIDLGPEGGAKGGEVLVAGTPETVAKCKRSYTGKYL